MAKKKAKKKARRTENLPGRARHNLHKYNQEFHDDMVYRLALLGYIDPEIADIFNISHSTFEKWKRTHRSFKNQLERGKVYADANVAKSLYDMAVGYEYDDTHIHVSRNQEDKVEVIMTPIIKHKLPEERAATKWLFNRQPHKWRDRKEITGAEGGPIQTKELTQVEAARNIAYVLQSALKEKEEEDAD